VTVDWTSRPLVRPPRRSSAGTAEALGAGASRAATAPRRSSVEAPGAAASRTASGLSAASFATPYDRDPSAASTSSAYGLPRGSASASAAYGLPGHRVSFSGSANSSLSSEASTLPRHSPQRRRPAGVGVYTLSSAAAAAAAAPPPDSRSGASSVSPSSSKPPLPHLSPAAATFWASAAETEVGIWHKAAAAAGAGAALGAAGAALASCIAFLRMRRSRWPRRWLALASPPW
jgi:hypothetical protein